jgi:membrane-bound ClpP family serine protease
MTDTPADRPPDRPPDQTQPVPPPGAGYGGYPAARPRNGMGTAAMVLGILALVLVVLIFFAPLGALLGLLAVIFGILGVLRANRREADNRGQALTGLVTGGVALLVGLLLTIGIGTFFAANVNDFRQFGRCMDRATGQEQRDACARELSRDLQR